MKVLASNTVFHVSNLSESVEFYTGILGFEVEFKYGTPTTYVGLSLGDAKLHLSCSYPYKNNTGHGSLYVVCDEVDTINKRCLAKSVEYYSHIAVRDYGLRDFSIKDPDGNQLGFGAEDS